MEEKELLGESQSDTRLEGDIVLFDDRIMILQDAPDEVTKGGILLPDLAKETPQQGTVVLVGPGRRITQDDEIVRVKPCVEVGDKVLFQKYAGIDFVHKDIKYLIMTEKDLILKFR